MADEVTTEPRYTLTEAARMLRAAECDGTSHEPDPLNMPNEIADADPDMCTCMCGLVMWVRFSTATDDQLRGDAPW